MLVVLPRVNAKILELGHSCVVTKLGIWRALVLGLAVGLLVVPVLGMCENIVAVHDLRHGLRDLLGVALARREREANRHGKDDHPEARERLGKRSTTMRREMHG